MSEKDAAAAPVALPTPTIGDSATTATTAEHSRQEESSSCQVCCYTAPVNAVEGDCQQPH
ncbi:hypothetical protein M407DRAFT_33703 [Tulasnella calospora MUT 4182]|uniref:Uncharacterized protein n=1 Tax=Tulasnella calospora MUT 4182 TaxID=1051891 RepID=A0A0C3L4W1_9AGAM|nr:hypothetical protein M407DRAFT_33703 [Tulasnella calospora MUT 4182]